MVDPDEGCAGGFGDREAGDGAIGQHVHPHRHAAGLAHFLRHHRHCGHGFRANFVRRDERDIAVVFHDQPIHAASAIARDLGKRDTEDGIEALAVIVRRTGQRPQMDHPDHRLAAAEQGLDRVGFLAIDGFG